MRSLVLLPLVAALYACADPCVDVPYFQRVDLFVEGGHSACKVITGEFRIGLNELDMPELERVDGNFIFEGGAVTKWSLPKLSEVTGDMRIKTFGAQLQTMSFGQLKTVGGVLTVNSGHLDKLELGALERAGALVISHLDGLETLELPKLATLDGTTPVTVQTAFPQPLDAGAGTAMFESLGTVRSISLPSLTTAGGLMFATLDVANALSAPKLESVRGWLYVYNTKLLTTWSFPEIKDVGSLFEVFTNKALRTVEVPKLEHIGGRYDVTDNPMLSQCAVDALAKLIESRRGIDEEYRISGNLNDVESCK